MSLFNTSVKNTIFNSIGFVWPIFLNLIFTPYIVTKLGLVEYGIMSISTLLWGYFSLLDFGVGSGNVKYIAEYSAKNEIKKVNTILNSLISFYLILGIIGSVILYFCSDFLSKNLFKIPKSYLALAIFAFQISAFGFTINIVKSIFDGIPKALNRFDLLNKINIFYGTFSTLLVVLVLYSNLGLKEVLVTKLSLNILILIISIKISMTLLPHYKYSFIIDKSAFKLLASYGFWEIMIRISNLAISSIGNFIISVMLGPAALTYYLIPQNLATRINGFNYKVSEILFPISSVLSSQNQLGRLRNVYIEMSKYSFAFRLSIYLPIIFFSYKILFYWMGKEFADNGWSLMIIMSFGLLLNSMAHLAGLITYGVAKLKLTAYFTTISFIILIISIYPCIKLWGITGAGIAYSISTFSYLILLGIVNTKILKIKNSYYFKEVILRSTLLTIPITLIIMLANFAVKDLISLIIVMITIFLIFNYLAIVFKIYSKSNFNKVLGMLISYLKKSSVFNSLKYHYAKINRNK